MPSNNSNSSYHYEELSEKGEFKKILEIAKSDKSIDGKYWEIDSLFQLGLLDQALSKAIEYQNHFTSDYWKAKYYNRYAAIYHEMGELDSALIYYDQSYKYLQNLPETKEFAAYHINMGWLYRQKGLYENALYHLINGHEIVTKIGYKQYLPYTLFNMGIIHKHKLEFDKAYENYIDSYNIFKKIGHKTEIVRAISLIVELLVLQQKHDEALAFFDSCAIKNEDLINKKIYLYYRYSEALIYKSSPRLNKKMRSQAIFEEIIRDNDVEFQLTLDVIPHLIELLLLEYQISREKYVLDEIESHLNLMQDVAQKNHMFPEILKTMILRAKLAFLEGKIDDIDPIFKTAKDIAILNNLNHIIPLIDKREEEIKDEFAKLKEMIAENNRLSDKIERDLLMDYIQEVQGVLKSSK